MAKILFVDDEAAICIWGQTVLEGRGYEFVKAYDGKDGLETYKEMLRTNSLPDLVITDYGLPRMNGERMIEEIIRLNKNQKIVLACAQDANLIENLRTKYNLAGVLRKPFRANDLVAKVQELLK